MTLASSDSKGETKGVMLTHKLFTADGGYVTDVVAPPFIMPPDVIVWGARVFLRVDSYDLVEFDPVEGSADGCYIEGFAYHAPPILAGEEPIKKPVYDMPTHMGVAPDMSDPGEEAWTGKEEPLENSGRDRKTTLELAISDAVTRIASNPQDVNYVKGQRRKIAGWAAELETLTGVYSNPDCIFEYCPHKDACKAVDVGCINLTLDQEAGTGGVDGKE